MNEPVPSQERFMNPPRNILNIVFVFALIGCEIRAADQPLIPTRPKAGVEDIAKFVDPSGDDWRSEILGEQARQQLAKLAVSLNAKGTIEPSLVPQIFAADAHIDPLRTDANERFK